MADKPTDKKYGGITATADSKKEKFPFKDSNQTKNLNKMTEHLEDSYTSQPNLQKSLQGVVDQQHKTMKDFGKMFSTKIKGEGGLNKRDLIHILSAQNKAISGSIAKVRSGEMSFPAEVSDSISQIASLMKKQLYFMKHMSGYFDDSETPPLLKMDNDDLNDMFSRAIKRGLHAAFPTFIRIGKAIGKPFYKLFRARGGNYIYSSHLSRADSPFKQISENIGVLYTGSMLRMDRMILFQKATAEAVRDLSTHTTGKQYAAVEDLKPSKKFRLITSLLKTGGKAALGLGAGTLGLTGALGLAPMLGLGGLGAAGLAAGGAGLGALLGWKKGGGWLKSGIKGMFGKPGMEAENRQLYGGEREKIGPLIGIKAKEAWEKTKGKLQFWKRKPEEDEPLLKGLPGGSGSGSVGGAMEFIKNKRLFRAFIRNFNIETKKRPMFIDISRKSIFTKKKTEGVLDVALSPDSQKVLQGIKEDTTKIVEGKIKPAKEEESIFSKILKWFPFIGIAVGFIKKLPGLIWDTLTSNVGSLLEKHGISAAIKGLLSGGVSGLFRLLFNPITLGIAGAALVGVGIGTLINKYFIAPWLEKYEDEKRKTTESFRKKLKEEWGSGIDLDLNKRILEGDLSEEVLQKVKHREYQKVFGETGAGHLKTKQFFTKKGFDSDLISQIIDSQSIHAKENIGFYMNYRPEELEKLRVEFLEKGDYDPYDDDYGPNVYGYHLEEKFREYVKKKLKPMDESKKNRPPINSLNNNNGNIIKTAEEAKEELTKNSEKDIIKKVNEAKKEAINRLQKDYGISASEAARYVDQAIKLNAKNTDALTDASILARTAADFINNTKEIPNGNNPSHYDADTDQDLAKAELNAASTADNISKTLEPIMDKQNKALTQVVSSVSRAGINSSNVNATNVTNTRASSNSNYNYPGQKDRWAEDAQNGRIFR